MKMFSFSRPNKRPLGFMTCLKSRFCVDISRYDTFHSETVDTQIELINFLKLWIEIRVHSSIVYSDRNKIRRKTSSLFATRSCIVILFFPLSSLNLFVLECSHKTTQYMKLKLFLVWLGMLCRCAEPISFFVNMHACACAWCMWIKKFN